MRRIALAIACSCVLVALGVLGGPAKAGDYYDGSYRNRGNVWYSSNCCYKKVIRHETSAHYVRVDEDRSYDRSSYYDRSYRSSSYYNPPRRYVDDSYYAPRRYVGYDNGGYSDYAQSCYSRRVRVADEYGGWVWSVRRVCN